MSEDPSAPPPAPATGRASGARRVGRWLALAGALVLVLSAGAMSVEAWRARGDDHRYPPPGVLVDVGARRMHLWCSGPSTVPTVVLEAGLGESGLSFAQVQGALDDDVRVCAVDRAGYGWSDPAEGGWTAAGAAADLAVALDAAGERGPYVLVGHSLGTFVARAFLQADRGAVAGMVLVEPTSVDAVIAAGQPRPAIVERRVTEVLIRLGAVRVFGTRLVAGLVGGEPPDEVRRALPAVYDVPGSRAAVRELEGTLASATALRDGERPEAWADLPLRVVTAADATVADAKAQADLAARSRMGDVVQASDGGHYVQYADPDLVVEQVREVLRLAR